MAKVSDMSRTNTFLFFTGNEQTKMAQIQSKKVFLFYHYKYWQNSQIKQDDEKHIFCARP